MDTLSGEFTCDPQNFHVTSDMLQSFKDRGYFLVRGFLTSEELAKIKMAVEHDRYLQHSFGHEKDDKEYKKVMWRHPGSDVTGMLTRSEKVAGTCEKVLGGEVYHYHTKLICKAATRGGQVFWHQDYGYWYKNGCLLPDMLSVFIPLDRCDKESGCLEVLERSHLCGRIDHAMNEGQTGAHLERVEELKKVCCHRVLEMQARDALFFHCNLLHRSGENVSNNKRWALIPAYNRRSNNPVYPHHHPQYTPLHKVPDSSIAACDNLDDLSRKQFNGPSEDKTRTYKEQLVQNEDVSMLQ